MACEFLMADLNGRGELRMRELYSYAALERVPGAGDLIIRCSTAMWQNPNQFDIALSSSSDAPSLRWSACAPTAGIATIRFQGRLMSLSLLASGLDPDADTITLRAFQTHLLRELHDTGIEPAFMLMELAERPLAATINFDSPSQTDDGRIVALGDRCFAASYFRYQGLC